MTSNLSELLNREAAQLSSSSSVQWLLRLISKPDIKPEQVVDVLAYDARLTAHVLKILNSPYYALSMRVESLTYAITVLGLQNLLELVLAIKMAERFDLFVGKRGESESFWRNCLFAASVARDLYRALGYNRHNLFAVTLLHHLGVLVQQQKLSPQLNAIPLAERGTTESQWDTGKSTLVDRHAEVGAELLARCGFPEIFIEVARYHHEFSRARHFAVEAAVVYLADTVAQQQCPLSANEGIADKPDSSVFRYVTLPPQRLQRLYQTVSARSCDTSMLQE